MTHVMTVDVGFGTPARTEHWLALLMPAVWWYSFRLLMENKEVSVCMNVCLLAGGFYLQFGIQETGCLMCGKVCLSSGGF